MLVLTYVEDIHADYVCEYFEKTGVEFFRVNTDKLITDYGLAFDSKKGRFAISGDSRHILLDDTWCIWNRRVMEPDLPGDFPKELENIVFAETERTWEGLLFSHRGRVVNDPRANFAANNKIDQLCFARGYGDGIETPETILTNVPDVLNEFYRERSKICHKLQRSAVVKKGDIYLITYNNIVEDEQIKQAHLIRRHPSLFQEYIDKEYELRITALENKIVGIAIHSQDSEQSKVDFRRYDFENVGYERVDLPTNVEKFCTELIKHYGLRFGEIDMICAKDGRYVFLEINPNGQWLWLQLMSDYNLTEDVAENLLI
ncbi:hypothetical protein HZB90_00750 [archaeon]|nr:hypothetical protein [archaeon]